MKIESIFKSQKIQILINLDNKDEFKIKISEITLIIRTNKQIKYFNFDKTKWNVHLINLLFKQVSNYF